MSRKIKKVKLFRWSKQLYKELNTWYYDMPFSLEFIYVIKCPYSNHVVYVGQTLNCNQRWRGHMSSKATSRIAKWIRAIKSLGKNPIFEMIDYTYGNSVKMEQHYIRYLTANGMCQMNTRLCNYYYDYCLKNSFDPHRYDFIN